MRPVLIRLVLSWSVVAPMSAPLLASDEAARQCDGSIRVSHLAPPRRDRPTQYRLYVRGIGPNANYYVFGHLPGDASSAHAEQTLLRALGIDPTKRIGDSHPSVEAAEKVAHEHCRAAQRAR